MSQLANAEMSSRLVQLTNIARVSYTELVSQLAKGVSVVIADASSNSALIARTEPVFQLAKGEISVRLEHSRNTAAVAPSTVC
jgi:hypothetical protein